MSCCLLLLPLWESVFVLCIVVRYLYVHSTFAIILTGKRELVALLSLSSWSLVIVVWLFLGVQWVCQPILIVAFPDHTHLLFLNFINVASGLGYNVSIFLPAHELLVLVDIP